MKQIRNGARREARMRRLARFYVLGQPANMSETWASRWYVHDRYTSNTVAGPFTDAAKAALEAMTWNQRP